MPTPQQKALVSAAHHRERFLRSVRTHYEQMHAQSLHAVIQMELGRVEQPRASQHRANLSLRLSDQPDQPLPVHTSILDVYELAHRKLLILGEPGVGKSTLLLDLALALVERAEQELLQPIPVVLPLSSWAERQLPLAGWIIEQCNYIYSIPRHLSQRLMAAAEVVPLLDGLDEMNDEAQKACIRAINVFHHKHPSSLVVCSRTHTYELAAQSRPFLATTVVVEPWQSADIERYLATLREPLTALRTALRTDSMLQAMARTPLMLQVLLLTYQGTTVPTGVPSEAKRSEHIWTDYTKAMISDRGDVQRYPYAVTLTCLHELAGQMRAQNQTIFFLDQIRPDWLSGKYRRFCGGSSGLVGGLVYGMIYALIGMLLSKQAALLVFIPLCAVVGLIGGLLMPPPPEHIMRPNPFRRCSLKMGLLILLTMMLAGVLVLILSFLLAEVVIVRDHDLVKWLVAGLVFGVPIGLTRGLMLWLDIAFRLIPRFWLWRSRRFPLRVIPFLDDATARLFLRRVGAGYSFTHWLLLDYFANRARFNAPAKTTTSTPPPSA